VPVNNAGSSTINVGHPNDGPSDVTVPVSGGDASGGGCPGSHAPTTSTPATRTFDHLTASS
jgi:hypothetical protein